MVPGKQNGYTFIELMVVATIILIPRRDHAPCAGHGDAPARNGAAARPCARSARRSTNTRMRAALQQISPLDRKPDDEGYPPDLETLVEGVTAANDQPPASSNSSGASPSIR